MKPIRLDIAGLNSFRRTVTIDFSDLLRDGLFGIFGPTGSGKSTILDAVSLALYGAVPRAGKNLSGIINDREESCSVSFTFDLLEGRQRQRYTAERLFVRSRTGGVEARKVRLSHHDQDGIPVPIAEKVIEFRERIEEILGINGEDFLRAVVLPQGAFSEFLSLTASRRSGMLERLFDLKHLGEQLQKTLRARRGRVAGDLRVVQERMSGLSGYDDTALLRLEESLVRAEEKSVELAALADREAETLKAARALSELVAELQTLQASDEHRRADRERATTIERALARAEHSRRLLPVIDAHARAVEQFERQRKSYQDAAQRLADAGSRAERATMERREAVREADAEIARLERNRSELIEVRTPAREAMERRLQLVQKEGELETAAKSLHDNSARADEAKRACDGIRLQVDQLRTREVSLTVSNDERTRAEQIRDLLRERDEIQADLHEQREAYEAASRNVNLLRSDLATRRRTLERIASDRIGLQGELDRCAAALKDIDQRRDDAVAERDRLAQALRDVEGMEKEVAGQRTREAEAATELAEKGKVLAARQIEVDRAQEEDAKLRRELDRKRNEHEKALHRDALLSLSSELVDGVPCRLCGSLHHPFPFHQRHDDQMRVAGGATATEVAAVEQKLEKARDELGEVREQAAALRAEVTALQQRIESTQRDISDRQRSIIARLRPLLPPDDEPTREQVAHRLEVVNRSITLMERDRGLLDERVRESTSKREMLDVRYHEEEVALGRDEATVKERERALEEIRTGIDRLDRRLPDVDARLNDRSGGRTIDEARRFAQEVAIREKEYVRIRDERSALETRLHQQEGSATEANHGLDELARRHDRIRAEVERLRADVEEREDRVRRVLRNVVERDQRELPIDDLISGIDRALTSVRKVREEKERLEGEAKEFLARCEQDHTHARDQMVRGEEEMEERGGDVEAALSRAGYRSADDVMRDSLDDATQAALREELSRIRRECDIAEARMEELQGKIGARSIATAEVEAQERAWRERKKEAVQAADDFSGLRREVEIARLKNQEWRAAKETMGKEEDRSRLYDRMERYLRGNGFVNFVANEHLVEICRRASTILATLTAGRYEVMARTGEGFIIGDNRFGGERGPGSLSGGETFLVSLSLALALSDTLQFERRPLEFFFLDEGFGSLDDELLDTVIDALERLAKPERAIGLISHVGQLRDRIQRKLIVAPPNGLDGTTVVTG